MQDDPTFIATETAPLVSPHDDPECAYLAMPQAMGTFAAPVMNELGHEEMSNGRAALLQVIEQLGSADTHGTVELASCDAAGRRFVDQVLGEGEIAVRITAPEDTLVIRESVFAGVWRVQHYAADKLKQDYLETGPVPRAVYEWADRLNAGPRKALPRAFPDGLMNAPALIAEIFDKSVNFSDDNPQILNLSLLPLTPEDSNFLVETLGLAGMFILSRGYGDCRINLTRLPRVWWVQYFNSPGQLILNTLEITRLPSVVSAAPEDLADSRLRIEEALIQLI